MCTSQSKEIVEIVQACVTVIAIIVGAFWTYLLFVRTRQKYPRANITHRLVHRPIINGKRLLRVIVEISNVGDVLLSLIQGQVRIQQILPPPPKILEPIESGKDPVRQGRTEILWPTIARRDKRWKAGQCEIEPGESYELNYDFIIDANIETIEVYTYFENVKKRKREIGWASAAFHDLYDKRENTSQR